MERACFYKEWKVHDAKIITFIIKFGVQLTVAIMLSAKDQVCGRSSGVLDIVNMKLNNSFNSSSECMKVNTNRPGWYTAGSHWYTDSLLRNIPIEFYRKDNELGIHSCSISFM